MPTDYPWFPLYVKDWLVSTAGMTDEQSGAYMRLLCHAWESEGLPVEEPAIQAIGRWAPVAWRRIWLVVGAKWEPRDGRLVNARQEDVRAEVLRHQAVRTASAQKAAAARWAHSGRNADALRIDAYPDPHPDPQKKDHDPSSLVAARFETFWTAYPRKTGRKSAEAAFAKLKPSHELLAEMLDAIQRQKMGRQWREGFVAHPATWLNGERWHDEVQAAPTMAPAAVRRAIGPARASWRDRCPHVPRCQTPTACELLTEKAATEVPA